MFRCQAAFNADSRKYAGSIAASAATRTRGFVLPDPPPVHGADWLARTYQRRVGRVLRVTYALAAATGFALIPLHQVDAKDVADLPVPAAVRRRHRPGGAGQAPRMASQVPGLPRPGRGPARAVVVAARRRRRPACPSFAHDNFLQKQDIELGWIRNVMRGASLEGLLVPVPADEAGVDAVDAVIRDWIGTPQSGGQLRYFSDTAARRVRLHRRSRTAVPRLPRPPASASACCWRSSPNTSTTRPRPCWWWPSACCRWPPPCTRPMRTRRPTRNWSSSTASCSASTTARGAGSSAAPVLRKSGRSCSTLGEAALAEHAEWTLMHRERPLEHTRLG